jgi:NAD(P)-dependent dehydrogenase (short-subunit alcohol dehydrogenase family)
MPGSAAEFDGLAALVTGGASGIGLATARLFAARGARVAILDQDIPWAASAGAGSSESEAGQGAGQAGRAVQGSADAGLLHSVVADVTDDRAVRAAVQAAASALGGIDILVNNAGIGAAGTVEDNDDDEWRRVLDVNVLGAVRVSRAALRELRLAVARHGQAVIVNTCSIAATAGLPRRALYSASKGAVQSLTLAMAADHVRQGIRVNGVTPGTADTPWVRRLLEAAPDAQAAVSALRARQPMGRLVTADEVAFAIAYLASPLSGSTTGTMLGVDGGMDAIRLG